MVKFIKKIILKVLRKSKKRFYIWTGKSRKIRFENVSIKLKINNEETYRRSHGVKKPLMDEVFEETREGDIFYDIGANIGKVSCLVGAKYDNVKIFAFEPDPKNVAMIRKNFELNRVDGEIKQYALLDENNQLSFMVPKKGSNAGMSNAVKPSRQSSAFWQNLKKEIEVPGKRGDDLIEEMSLPVPSIIKMDIEGAELKALYGLEKTLGHSKCRTVICEVHDYLIPDFGGTSQELEHFLEKAGFEINTFDERKYNTERGERAKLYRIKAKK